MAKEGKQLTTDDKVTRLEGALKALFTRLQGLEKFNKFLLTNLIENCAQTSGVVDFIVANEAGTLDEISFHSEMAREAIIEEVFKDGKVNPEGLAITKLSAPKKEAEPAPAKPIGMAIVW